METGLRLRAPDLPSSSPTLEQVPRCCLSRWLSSWVRAARRGSCSAGSASAQPAASTQAGASRAQASWGAALFGRKSVKVGADQQLAAALESIEARMQQSEQRAVELRAQALKARRGGMRGAALRSLKLSKAAEEKVARLGNLAVAIERQRDSLEDVGLQQNVASALGAGVQGMRKAQAALKGVEKVADDTIEMRDVADDLASAFATNAEGLADVFASFADPGGRGEVGGFGVEGFGVEGFGVEGFGVGESPKPTESS